ncbi:MAG: hypothetical protein P9L99_18705 [Candidatus Lernaella stagnicola]|nr:hypothetical protein [Candidatus Lernaella stagnicola]
MSPPRLFRMWSSRRYTMLFALICLGALALPFIFYSCNIDPDYQTVVELDKKKIHWIHAADEDLLGTYLRLHPTVSPEEASRRLHSLVNGDYRIIFTTAAFLDVVTKIETNKRAIVTGVSGGGLTTVATRASVFLAGDGSRFEKFDVTEGRDGYERLIERRNPETWEWEWGFLPKFMFRAAADPENRYVFVIDNMNKTSTNRLFGSKVENEFKQELNDARKPPVESGQGGGNVTRQEINTTTLPSGRTFSIPKNVYLVVVIDQDEQASGALEPGLWATFPGHIEIESSPAQALEYFRSRGVKTAHRRLLTYLFMKSNRFMREQYGPDMQIGLWGACKNYCRPEELSEFKRSLIRQFDYLLNKRAISVKEPLNLEKIADFETVFRHRGIRSMRFVAKRTRSMLYFFVALFGNLAAVMVIFMTGVNIYYWLLTKRNFRDVDTMLRKIAAAHEYGRLPSETLLAQLAELRDTVFRLVGETKLDTGSAELLSEDIHSLRKEIRASLPKPPPA